MRTHLFCLFFGYHPISRGFICRFCGEVAKGRELPFSLMVGKEFGKAGLGQMQIFLMDSSCDTPTQGLIGLIGYSYQQVTTFFFGSRPERTPRLSVLGLEQSRDGWPTGKLFPDAHEWGQSVQKRLVLVCEDSLCPRKQPDVSGPGLGEAGRYNFIPPKPWPPRDDVSSPCAWLPRWFHEIMYNI